MTAPALTAPSGRAGRRLPATSSIAWPLVGIAVVLLLHLAMAFSRALSWDEFFHYNQIHVFLQGELARPLQTLQDRLFAWVTLLPGNSVDHVIVIRVAMFGCLAAAAAGVFLVAERFVERPVAALATLLYLSGGFVLQHGTAFRADPMAAAVLMTSLALMLRSNLSPTAIFAIAALAALGALLTIKTAIYAPAFAGIAWLRWTEAGRSRAMTWRLAALALSVPVLFGIFFLLHSSGLAEGSVAKGGDIASNSAEMMFTRGEVLYVFVAKAAGTAPVLALAVVSLPLLLWRQRAQAETAALAGMWLPLLVLLIYRNSWPYFYVFLLPPIIAASAVAVVPLARRYSVAAITGVLLVNAAAVWATDERGVLERQRAVVTAAHEIFPRPVAYFDFPGMLAPFRKANGFLTTWGTVSYQNGRREPFHVTMEREAVPLFVENKDMFAPLLRSREPIAQLFPADQAAIRSTYVNFWGPFWLAGKIVPADGAEHSEEFLVPGPYTVRDAPMTVDGRSYQPGDVMQLERGTHVLRAPAAKARLIWGENLREPSYPAPQPPYWTLF